MQLDLGGHPAQAGSKRPAIAGYASLVGNRVGQKGNSRGLAGLYPGLVLPISLRSAPSLGPPSCRKRNRQGGGSSVRLVLTPPADQGIRAGKVYNQRETLMDLLIVVIVLLFLFGGLGGGYYGYSHYGAGGGGGILVVVLVICVVLYLLRGRRL